MNASVDTLNLYRKGIQEKNNQKYAGNNTNSKNKECKHKISETKFKKQNGTEPASDDETNEVHKLRDYENNKRVRSSEGHKTER